MYTMKQTCDMTGLSYETLKFYCNQGLVPNVKRDSANRRIFDERDVEWLKGLICLKNCGMSIEGMKQYMKLCMQGKVSIPVRQQILSQHREALVQRIHQLQQSIDSIDAKNRYYDDVLAGKVEYTSNLIRTK